MGLFRFSSGTTPAAGEPVPHRFTVLRTHEGPAGTVALIRYPDATTFGGLKVCFYLGTDAAALREADVLDPHFTPVGLAPFARFEPTDAGWAAAVRLAEEPPIR